MLIKDKKIGALGIIGIALICLLVVLSIGFISMIRERDDKISILEGYLNQCVVVLQPTKVHEIVKGIHSGEDFNLLDFEGFESGTTVVGLKCYIANDIESSEMARQTLTGKQERKDE